MPALTGDEMSTLAAIAYEFDGELKDRPQPSIFDFSSDAFFAGERWGTIAARMPLFAQKALRSMFDVARTLYHSMADHPPRKFRQVLEELQHMPETPNIAMARAILLATTRGLAQREERESKAYRCPMCNRLRSSR